MASFLAKQPVRGRGPAYDVRAVEAPRYYGGLSNSPLLSPLRFLKNMGQGACAGLLTLLGAMHLTSAVSADGSAVEALGPGTLEGIAETLLQGGGPGALEILGAVALFLNAGRGPARLLGLMSFVVIVAAHANGMDHADLLEKASDTYALIQSYIQKFQLSELSVLDS